jgi:transposase-like protein
MASTSRKWRPNGSAHRKSRRIHVVHCHTCKRRSSERKGTVLEHARLPDEKCLAILKHIEEGRGTRDTGRRVEVDKNTVIRYLAVAGTHAEKLHDELVALSPRTSPYSSETQ